MASIYSSLPCRFIFRNNSPPTSFTLSFQLSTFRIPPSKFPLQSSYFPPGRRPLWPLRAGGRIPTSNISAFRPPSLRYALCSLPFALCSLPHALCPMLSAPCPLLFALCPLPFAHALCPIVNYLTVHDRHFCFDIRPVVRRETEKILVINGKIRPFTRCNRT